MLQMFSIVTKDSFDKISEKFKGGMYFIPEDYMVRKEREEHNLLLIQMAMKKVINTLFLYGKSSRD